MACLFGLGFYCVDLPDDVVVGTAAALRELMRGLGGVVMQVNLRQSTTRACRITRGRS